MDVRCDRCQTEYELDDASVSAAGASVQCTTCGHTFVVSRAPPRPTSTPPQAANASEIGGAAAAAWMLTSETGKTHRFRDAGTLQKWIVERRVGRTDRACPPGGDWHRLGDMEELRPFFEIVDQADRAAAARAVGPTRPETPRGSRARERVEPAQRERDDEVLASARTRFDSEIDPDLAGMSTTEDLIPAGFWSGRARRGVVFAASVLALAGVAVVAFSLGRRPASTTLSAAPVSPSRAAAPLPAAPPPPTAAPAIAAAPAPSPAPALPPSSTATTTAPVASAAPPPSPPARPAPTAVPAAPDPVAASRAAPAAAERAPSRPRSYEELVAEADHATENGATAKAQKLYDEALRMQPDGVAAVTGLGYLQLDKERPLAAIGMFKRALATAPMFPQALFGLGEAYRNEGQWAPAIEAYQRYLASAPGGEDAPAARRQIHDLEARLPAASPHAETALPTSPPAAARTP